MKNELVKIMFFLAGLLCCNSSFASNGPPPPTPPTPPGFPIDGELIVLFFASIILGFYKIYNFKKASR